MLKSSVFELKKNHLSVVKLAPFDKKIGKKNFAFDPNRGTFFQKKRILEYYALSKMSHHAVLGWAVDVHQSKRHKASDMP